MRCALYHFVFDELADLLASMDPDKVLAFRTSERSQSRLEALLEKNQAVGGLTKAEQKEVEQFMLVEHIVSLAKARALQALANNPAHE